MTPIAWAAPVMQDDGRIITQLFKTEEEAVTACRRFEDDCYCYRLRAGTFPGTFERLEGKN